MLANELAQPLEGIRTVAGHGDHVADSRRAKAAQRPLGEGDAADLDHRLRAIVGERAKPLSLARH